MEESISAEREVRVEPMDEHNRALVGNVHPGDWVNPEPKPRYHLVAIGAGAGGLISSAIAAGLGGKVALIERHLMGGDCLNVGCVPSKGVISAARSWKKAAESSERFGGPGVTGPGRFADAMERMRRLRAGISPVDSVQRFADLGIDVFLGHANFTGPDTIEVDGTTLNFRRAVIATGARAAAPPIPGLEDSGYLTNETIFTLTELPRRLIVVGAGPIGCEMAQSFARFGSDVTVLDRSDHILPREDTDAAAVVQEAFERDGVRYESGVSITRVEREGNERRVHYERGGREESVLADELLIAVGRAPNLDLGLEAAGVEYDPRQGVHVDDELRTSNRTIYAVGDICSQLKFTHMADAQARMVVQNALFFGHKKVSRLVVPWATYTSPEIAHVGYYAEDAKRAGFDVATIKIPLDDVDRAILDGEDEGFLKIHVNKKNGRLLGGTLVAEHAGDMIGELALAVTHRMKASALADTIHPYPTQGEVFRKAGDAWRRQSFTPFLSKAFAMFFKVFR